MWRSFCKEPLAMMNDKWEFLPSVSPPELAHGIETGPVLQITPSERYALQLVAHGAPTSRIGTMLGLVPADIGSFLTALFARLGATSRAEAIRVASRRGLLMPSLNGPAIDLVATEPNEYPSSRERPPLGQACL
jgi:DNA-binding CsgD family transcriptional regulator